MNPVVLHVFALIFTIFVESIIIWLFIKKEPHKIFFYAVLINSFTVPVATYTYQNILNNFLFIEFFVFILEVFLIMLLLEIKFKKAVLVSFMANFVTSAIGFLFF